MLASNSALRATLAIGPRSPTNLATITSGVLESAAGGGRGVLGQPPIVSSTAIGWRNRVLDNDS
eukprot:9371562-Lingulodinium_polyedra.AAC.1